jgi:AAA domain/Bifunctional DNA primase/polymerase, N-terminal
MSIPSGTDEALSVALNDARTLVSLGVPIVTGPLDRSGNPRGPRWNGWERTRPNLRPIERWQPGEAMGAVTGGVFDVIDVDPRNGGLESLAAMAEALGEDGPDEYWRVKTSSGGRHIYIAPLGLGGHNKFMPGLDLKSRGGFVFIPPTVRPSKAETNLGAMVAYQALTRIARPIGRDQTGGHIRDFITECLANRGGGSRVTGGRRTLSALEAACLSAGNGGQRDALMDLVTELSRSSDDDEYVVWRTMRVVAEMENFTKRRPWKEADIRGLLYAEGKRPIGDANAEEAAILAELKAGAGDGPMVSSAMSGLRPLTGISKEVLRWLWFRYLAFGDASLIDSFAGVGKSLTALDIIARATTGRGMPFAEEVLSGALNVLLLAPEDRAPVQRMRLEAAGADLARVFIPDIEIREARVSKKSHRTEKKAYLGGHLITFPSSTEQFHKWIKQYSIGLVVVDPIAAFLDQDVNSSNDASVRRALEPFVTVLGLEDCAAWMIRHFNKDSSQSASLRGGGSVAFGAVARTHMIAGEMPDENSVATHAIALVKTNNVKRTKNVALGYSIVDSEMPMDEQGSMVPIVEWHGEVPVDLERLAGKKTRGPEPTTQNEWRAFLHEIFGLRDTYLVSEIQDLAASRGLPWDHKIYDKVLESAGVRKERTGKRGQPGATFSWTVRKLRTGRPPGRPRRS